MTASLSRNNQLFDLLYATVSLWETLWKKEM
jgi:hypothetical protein